MISGADEPKAIKVRFATVAFQNGTNFFYSLPLPSDMVTGTLIEVNFSIASINFSAMIETPKNK